MAVTDSTNKAMFTLAALFNWLVGLALVVDAPGTMAVLNIAPPVTELTFVRMLGGLVLIFGLGYYWAGTDLRANAAVIRLGVIGKLWVFAIALFQVLVGEVSWQLLVLASGDLLFALLFIRALKGIAHDPETA